jgi:hypothetical protein
MRSLLLTPWKFIGREINKGRRVVVGVVVELTNGFLISMQIPTVHLASYDNESYIGDQQVQNIILLFTSKRSNLR